MCHRVRRICSCWIYLPARKTGPTDLRTLEVGDGLSSMSVIAVYPFPHDRLCLGRIGYVAHSLYRILDTP